MSPAVNTQPPNPSLPATSGTQGMQYDNLGRKIGTAPNTDSLNASNTTETDTTPQIPHAAALGNQLASYGDSVYTPTTYMSHPGTPNQLPVYGQPTIPNPIAPVAPVQNQFMNPIHDPIGYAYTQANPGHTINEVTDRWL